MLKRIYAGKYETKDGQYTVKIQGQMGAAHVRYANRSWLIIDNNTDGIVSKETDLGRCREWLQRRGY